MHFIDRMNSMSYINECETEAEFTRVYNLYADDIFRLCFSFMKNQMDAEDATQETFLKFYHAKNNFSSEEHLKAWLIVTASNHCKNLLKHWWRKRRDIEDYKEKIGKEDVQTDEIMELVMKLPEKYKTVVYLYYYEGYDSREIAELLHKPAPTVRSYLQKARKLLRQEFM